MEKINISSNGQWELEKMAWHRTAEEDKNMRPSLHFQWDTSAEPHLESGFKPVGSPSKTMAKDKKTVLYHHIFRDDKSGSTHHILSKQEKPDKDGKYNGVAASMMHDHSKADRSKTGNTAISQGIVAHEIGKGYGSQLLNGIIHHHGQWISGDSFSSQGTALTDRAAKLSDHYDYIPDAKETKLQHDAGYDSDALKEWTDKGGATTPDGRAKPVTRRSLILKDPSKKGKIPETYLG